MPRHAPFAVRCEYGGERFALRLAQTGLQGGGHAAQAQLFEGMSEFDENLRDDVRDKIVSWGSHFGVFRFRIRRPMMPFPSFRSVFFPFSPQ